jgi:SAM-dependent methyltransferase
MTAPHEIPPNLLAESRVITEPDDCFFYHTMDLPELGTIHAHWDLRGRFDEYIGGVNLTGKTVLDVGTATGFLSFEAEKRGASQVVSFDMSDVRQQTLLPFRDKDHYIDKENWARIYGKWFDRWKNGYWLCHRLLDSRASVVYGSVYEMPVALGQFDVVILGSVVEHLSDAVSALGSIARVTKKTLVIVTPLLPNDEPIAHFAGRATHPDNDYTWWVYSIGVYREVLAMLGFTVESVSTGSYYYKHGDIWEERSTIVAVRT